MLHFSLGGSGDGLRLLCLGAHADDIEIGCGGTILRLREERPDLAVRWVVFSGDERRRSEAEASARYFLAGLPNTATHVLGFRDGFFPAQFTEIKTEFEKLRRGFEPTLILTHYREDSHQDHRLLSALTYQTFRDHLICEYEIAKFDGDLGNPNLFFPLSAEQCRRKVFAVMEHFPSQHGRHWFTSDAFMSMMRLRGIGCHAPSGYAEAFYCRRAIL